MLKYLLFFTFIVFALAVPFSAHAYLDPGTGSFVIQILIAGVATVIFSIKVFWRKIKELFLLFSKRNNGK